MGFMDELRKLTQPYGDDDDFYDGADESLQQQNYTQDQVDASLEFEDTFADNTYEEPAPAPAKKQKASGGGFFANLKNEASNAAAQAAPKNSPKVSKAGKKNSASFSNDTQVVLFNPKTFEDAGELVTYLNQGRSLVMALEGVSTDTARRLLDFISGIAYALNGKITPVSAKTYFVTPENVDLLDAQGGQSSGSSIPEEDEF